MFPASAGTTPSIDNGTGPGMHRRRGNALTAANGVCRREVFWIAGIRPWAGGLGFE